MIFEFDQVQIINPIDDLGEGSIGTVVHIYPPNFDGNVPAYEVEFPGNHLKTISAENLCKYTSTQNKDSETLPDEILEAMASAMLEPSIGKADSIGNPVRKKVLQRAFDAAYKLGWFWRSN